jgi:ligand-binding SRPBCC domain-containing protein
VLSGEGQTPAPHELAWEYDLVVTTFQRLSNEWVVSTRKRRLDIPLLQVSARGVWGEAGGAAS